MEQNIDMTEGSPPEINYDRLVLTVRQIETGNIVAYRPFSKDEMDAVTASYLPSSQAKLEYKGAELIEDRGISSSYTDLYLCLESDGFAHLKSNFENGEYAAQMVYRRQILDKANALGNEAHRSGLDHPADCEETKIILETDTAWWPNQTESSAKQAVIDAWKTGWADAAEAQQELARDEDSSPSL